jgi:hypothetical protein
MKSLTLFISSNQQVGTMAAKRALEKTSDRVKRTMLEEAALMKSPTEKTRPIKASASPNLEKVD